ncbi:MAG: fibronectin type III domain-containing protein, partial [Flavobacteriales bacterium]|nr:fibronectin type III domain-containing protein [Flavobacteriales bacterium]
MAQVAQYGFSYDKLLQTSSTALVDENAAFEPITGGTVLADGTHDVSVGGNFGVGYTTYETVSGGWFPVTRPASFQGNASFVGNAGAGDGGTSDAEYQLTGAPVLKTGPGYPIGFDFTYNGEVFDRVGISGQGWIGFGNSDNGSTAVGVYTAPQSSTTYLPLSYSGLLENDSRRNRVVATGVSGGTYNLGTNIMPIVYNMNFADYPGAELRYETIGSAPNRVFVVQWRNYGFTISSLDQQYYRRMDFQIRLYETTNEVEVRFGKAWRSNTTAYFQTGLGGKTASEFTTFGFYNAPTNAWLGWPYTWTVQADHNGYPGSSAYSQRIPWAGAQGYAPYDAYGTGSAQDYYAAIFHQLSPLQPSPYNVSNQTISGTGTYTPDMMSFTWTTPTCLLTASNVAVSGVSTNSATLSWSGTGTFDYAVGTDPNPANATLSGTVTANSATLSGLNAMTTYNAWVRTNCGSGDNSVWLQTSFATLPCAVPSSLPYGAMPITRVQIADINNSSTNTTSTFENFTSVVGHVESPLSYPITVEASNPYSDMYATAYFDWDQDGVFDDTQQIGHSTAGSAVFTGTINISAAALAGNCRMRVVTSYYLQPANACAGPTYGGQTEDYLLDVTPATCIPPSAAGMNVSNITAHTADLGWSASSGGNIEGYAWEVRSSGNPGDPSPAASGTTAAGVTTATASGLAAYTAYTLYVRSDCGTVDGQSVWMSKTFTTELGCSTTWVSPGGVAGLTDQAFTQTRTICPDNAGDAVTVNFTTWNGLRWNAPNASRMYIYDGDNTSAPMVQGGNGPAYSGSEWTIPAGGWTSINTANKPPIITSTAASGCLTVQVYSAGTWTGGMGWSADFTCAPAPTCFAPTSRTVTGTTEHGASFSWNAGASPNVEYKVVAFGSLSGATAITSGTSSTGTATTADVLTANTDYTVFFRGLCDDEGTGDDPSAWSDPGVNFRTKIGCGGPYTLYSSPSYVTYTAPKDSTIVLCPETAGDVVTLTVSKFSFGTGGNLAGLFVHNGNSTAAPLFHSGMPSLTLGANTLGAGAFRGVEYRHTTGNPGTPPGPFTSTAANGCLTLSFQAFSTYTYDVGMESMIGCAPPPACSTPDNVAATAIGNTTATVSWGNTTEPCIVEYGPVGFTPGTGATAGLNGTIASASATSPLVISGLTGSTKYSVFVRQVCSGSTYSANSFIARFATSKDCSTAQAINCGQYLSDDDAPAPYLTGSAAYDNVTYTNAQSCFSTVASADGPERFYRFTATEAGTHAIMAGVSDMGGSSKVGYVIAPVADGCAASAFTCLGTVQANTGGTLSFNVPAPGDYYLLSDANSGVHKRPFTLLCPGVPACATAPTYPPNGATVASSSTPFNYTWPAVFGATSYDVYFMGTLVANTPTNSINSDDDFTTAAVAAAVGFGNAATWRVVPKNSYGAATCPSEWSFRVGGNGMANAIPLTDGAAFSGNVHTANGYSNQNGTWWGNDSWYKFTASDCGDSAEVNLCLPSTAPSNYLALQVYRQSDNAVMFPPSSNSSYYANVAPGNCLKYEWFNYDPEVWNWMLETPKFQVQPGETYYVVVDGYNYGYDFTVSYNEISNSPDSDEDGVLDCMDNCPFLSGADGDPCTPNAGFGAGRLLNCECVDGNMAVISITTDGNPEQLGWEVTDASGLTVLANGTPNAANTTVSETVFLAGSCYGFRLTDSFGDGLANGGWELRTTDGKTILRDDFASGSASPASPAASAGYGTSHSFCLPLGTAHIAANECGIFNNDMLSKVYCNKV